MILATATTLRLAGLIVPLGLDTLGVALALGMAGLPPRRRVRIALLFACFEAAMPLLGGILGAPLGHAIGGVAHYAAAALLLALGLWLALDIGDDDLDAGRLLSLASGGVRGAALLGVSISLDELAIGFSAGLLHVPIAALAAAVAAQAFLLTTLGLWIGARVAPRAQQAAERLAGVALIALALVLIIAELR